MTSCSDKWFRITIQVIALNILLISSCAAQGRTARKPVRPKEISYIKKIVGQNDSVLFHIMEHFLVSSSHISLTQQDDFTKNHTLDSLITSRHIQYVPRKAPVAASAITAYNKSLEEFEKITKAIIDKTTCKLTNAGDTTYIKAYVAFGTARDQLLKALP